ncbi:hypothetical protein IJC60_06370 [bacterium]|nr:hypothetical protein [bacterium]
MQVAKISPIILKRGVLNPQKERKLTFSGVSRDTFVWHNSEYAKHKMASEKARNTPALALRHASGSLIDKLDGLQFGVRTFENTPIKEIYHIIKKVVL